MFSYLVVVRAVVAVFLLMFRVAVVVALDVVVVDFSACSVFLAGNLSTNASGCLNHSIEVCVILQSHTVAAHLSVK